LLALLVTLIVVAVVQVLWWIFDQAQYARAVQAQLQAIADGQRAVDATTLAAAEAQRMHRTKQYAWEGAFFLAVLTACLAGVWRALHAEIRIRHRQDAFLALVSHQFKTPLASLKLAKI
jgi:signal transduction histidine kinase